MPGLAWKGMTSFCFIHGPAGDVLLAFMVRYGKAGTRSGAGLVWGVPR